jgi:6-pyruvoyltetrahydropterin/6-carboxytetrahydropterin synthase
VAPGRREVHVFEISYETTFCAMHRLTRGGEPIEPRHGHDWRVEVVAAAAELDAAGVVLDFGALTRALQEVVAPLHQTDLNDHPAFRGGSPSAEAVARYIFGELRRALAGGSAQLTRVRIWEAPGCSATFCEPTSC